MREADAARNEGSRSPWLYLILGGLLVAVLFSAMYFFFLEDEAGPGELESVTIAQFGDFFLYAPLYVAIDAGFFEQNGLRVSLVSTGGDEKTWAAVLSGDASFGVADPAFVAISAERGQPGKVVGNIVNGVPFWGVTYDDTLVYSEPTDLSGITVATFPSPSTAYTLQKKMFDSAGLEPAIREGAFGALLTMLKAEQADVALELEPNVSRAIDDGARVLYSLAEVYGDFAITGFTTSDVLIQHDPDLVFSAVCSLQMGLDYIRDEREAALQILQSRFPEVESEVAAVALNRVLDESIIPTTLVTSETAWKKAVDLRVEVGDLDDPGTLAEYVENQFASRAAAECRL